MSNERVMFPRYRCSTMMIRDLSYIDKLLYVFIASYTISRTGPDQCCALIRGTERAFVGRGEGCGLCTKTIDLVLTVQVCKWNNSACSAPEKHFKETTKKLDT